MSSKYTFTYKIEGDLLKINYSGTILGKQMAEIMEKIYTLLRNNYIDKVLIDARESEVFLEFRESLDFATNHPPEFLRVKTAVVENKTKEAQYKLYEMFVKNRDLSLSFFTSLEEAILWLE
jgi:hypothetical protein